MPSRMRRGRLAIGVVGRAGFRGEEPGEDGLARRRPRSGLRGGRTVAEKGVAEKDVAKKGGRDEGRREEGRRGEGLGEGLGSVRVGRGVRRVGGEGEEGLGGFEVEGDVEVGEGERADRTLSAISADRSGRGRDGAASDAIATAKAAVARYLDGDDRTDKASKSGKAAKGSSTRSGSVRDRIRDAVRERVDDAKSTGAAKREQVLDDVEAAIAGHLDRARPNEGGADRKKSRAAGEKPGRAAAVDRGGLDRAPRRRGRAPGGRLAGDAAGRGGRQGRDERWRRGRRRARAGARGHPLGAGRGCVPPGSAPTRSRRSGCRELSMRPSTTIPAAREGPAARRRRRDGGRVGGAADGARRRRHIRHRSSTGERGRFPRRSAAPTRLCSSGRGATARPARVRSGARSDAEQRGPPRSRRDSGQRESYDDSADRTDRVLEGEIKVDKSEKALAAEKKKVSSGTVSKKKYATDKAKHEKLVTQVETDRAELSPERAALVDEVIEGNRGLETTEKALAAEAKKVKSGSVTAAAHDKKVAAFEETRDEVYAATDRAARGHRA